MEPISDIWEASPNGHSFTQRVKISFPLLERLNDSSEGDWQRSLVFQHGNGSKWVQAFSTSVKWEADCVHFETFHFTRCLAVRLNNLLKRVGSICSSEDEAKRTKMLMTKWFQGLCVQSIHLIEHCFVWQSGTSPKVKIVGVQPAIEQFYTLYEYPPLLDRIREAFREGKIKHGDWGRFESQCTSIEALGALIAEDHENSYASLQTLENFLSTPSSPSSSGGCREQVICVSCPQDQMARMKELSFQFKPNLLLGYARDGDVHVDVFDQHLSLIAKAIEQCAIWEAEQLDALQIHLLEIVEKTIPGRKDWIDKVEHAFDKNRIECPQRCVTYALNQRQGIEFCRTHARNTSYVVVTQCPASQREAI